jgi:uncharacterized protein DUF4058
MTLVLGATWAGGAERDLDMASPFPGMDPYLEDPAVWLGLHNRLIVYGSDALQPLLLPGYYVEIRERVYFEQSRDVIYPDATLHREKQGQVLGSRANLVEIDLLRRGSPVVVAPPGELLTLPRFDYLACVSRASDRRHVEVYAATLRERLPRIAIPLREPDPDVVLDLPSIFTQCYDNGAHAVRVDYDQPPPEPFRPDDEAWADALLRNAGLRGQSGGEERP